MVSGEPVASQPADEVAVSGVTYSELRAGVPVRPRASALRRAVGPGPDDGAPAAP